MIDTLEIGQRVKIKIAGKLVRAEITGLDPKNDCFHVIREEGSPRRVVCSWPMLFEVWDKFNMEWVDFLLPEEEGALVEVLDSGREPDGEQTKNFGGNVG